MDEDNHNAQNLNAKAMLSRFRMGGVKWIATHIGSPDPRVANNRNVELTRLWRHRLWSSRMWLHYLGKADAIFYPGVDQVDLLGLRMAKRLYPRRPVIATLEGLAGTAARERQLRQWAGHDVPCQPVSAAVLARIDEIMGMADHVVAISPFLESMGRRLYGDKFSQLPLGIDRKMFFPDLSPPHHPRPVAMSVGTVTPRKRPELFIELAVANPEAKFIWIGDGPLLAEMRGRATARGLENLVFEGRKPPAAIAAAMRSASIFVMPSRAEGVPKVVQEAVACGLPVVLFGHYEAPSVVDGENGHVVWTDEDFSRRVRILLDDPARARAMGQTGALRARDWDWDVLAPAWEEKVTAVLGR